MTTTDPQIAAWLDQMDQLVAKNIRTNGVHLEHIFGEPSLQRASMTYTVGLFGIAHPELLVLGMCHHDAFGMLNYLAAQIRDGRQLVAGELITFPDWPHRVVVEVCPNPGEIVFGANRHYQRPDEASVPVLQLTTDDKAGLFPWDDGYSVPTWIQPRPGTFSA